MMKYVFVLVAISQDPIASYSQSVAVFKEQRACFSRLQKVQRQYPYTQMFCFPREVTYEAWKDTYNFNKHNVSVLELKK